MATKKVTKKTRPAAADPMEAANARVLKDRDARIAAAQPEPIDLGLKLDEKPAENAAEFLSEEWDRKAFGDPVATIKRTVFGPDPLVDQCPEMKARLEKYGLVDYANATAEAILLHGASKIPDPVMAGSLRAAIARFGKKKVAEAFRDRILSIPVREIEIDASDTLDPLILGGNILRDIVKQYERPGMAYKFLSPYCIGVIGQRGYVIVKDKNGDPVKAGTLILGEIPQEIADARRQHFAALSEQEVAETEEAYREALARPDANFNYRGAKVEGVGAVGAGDSITVNASETEANLGETRSAGFRIERQERVERRHVSET